MKYYPYGGLIEGGAGKYLYTGKELDRATDLYYYEARYYNPEVGRFVQPDTIIPEPYNPQSLNRYSYVMNNPVKYTDPSGHVPFPIIAAALVGGAFLGGVLIAEFADPFDIEENSEATEATPEQLVNENNNAETGEVPDADEVSNIFSQEYFDHTEDKVQCEPCHDKSYTEFHKVYSSGNKIIKWANDNLFDAFALPGPVKPIKRAEAIDDAYQGYQLLKPPPDTPEDDVEPVNND